MKITHNTKTDAFDILITIPRKQKGKYTYGDGEWEQDALCVVINEKYQEYTLNHTIYLDYKDSLQVGPTIVYFDNKQEALDFAEKYELLVTTIKPDYGNH